MSKEGGGSGRSHAREGTCDVERSHHRERKPDREGSLDSGGSRGPDWSRDQCRQVRKCCNYNGIAFSFNYNGILS